MVFIKTVEMPEPDKPHSEQGQIGKNSLLESEVARFVIPERETDFWVGRIR
jgi:hypothetical protein